MTMPENLKPDFAVVGGQHGGGVYLIASNTLKSAKIETVHERCWRSLDPISRVFADESWTVFNLASNDLVVVIAPTYREAWVKLFEIWSPEQRSTKHVESQRSIES